MNENTENVISTDEKIIKTDVGAKNGQDKCPKCGATLRPHRACTKCGYYKNEEVIKVENKDAE